MKRMYKKCREQWESMQREWWTISFFLHLLRSFISFIFFIFDANAFRQLENEIKINGDDGHMSEWLDVAIYITRTHFVGVIVVGASWIAPAVFFLISRPCLWGLTALTLAWISFGSFDIHFLWNFKWNAIAACAYCVTVFCVCDDYFGDAESQLVYLVHDAESSEHVHRTPWKWNTSSSKRIWIEVFSFFSVSRYDDSDRRRFDPSARVRQPKPEMNHMEVESNAILCRLAPIIAAATCFYAFISLDSSFLFATFLAAKNAKNKTIAMPNGGGSGDVDDDDEAHTNISAATGGCL